MQEVFRFLKVIILTLKLDSHNRNILFCTPQKEGSGRSVGGRSVERGKRKRGQQRIEGGWGRTREWSVRKGVRWKSGNVLVQRSGTAYGSQR
tara:strand:+ start:282 stop:557 length:276 start_codon:yes stop_codon:yes gene_type:complete